MSAANDANVVTYGSSAIVALQSGAALPSQFLTFMLGEEQYAVGILHIKEIIEYGSLATVPMMPDCVRGVINLRGAVVPVMDLSARFGRAPSTIGKRSCIVIVETGGEEGESKQVLGMLVDAVNAVVEIAAADIEPAPSFGTRIRPDFIAGMGKHNGRFVILLEIGRVLSSEEIVEMARGSAAVA
jgi:purine-binding chemotaxis protein CheW